MQTGRRREGKALSNFGGAYLSEGNDDEGGDDGGGDKMILTLNISETKKRGELPYPWILFLKPGSMEKCNLPEFSFRVFGKRARHGACHLSGVQLEQHQSIDTEEKAPAPFRLFVHFSIGPSPDN